MPLTPEQFRTLFADMLADPESRTLFAQSLVQYFPIEGGTCPSGQTAGKLAKFLPLTVL
jgi:hypothetical protein